MQNFNQKTSKGLNLIELLLVLGVVAILLVAAFVVYPQVRDRNQANSEISNSTAIKASINNLYASKGGKYTGLTTLVANQARAFPISMNGGDYTLGATPGDITSAWGGAVTVAVNGASTSAFDITYAAVPSGVCLGFISGAATTFKGVTVGSTVAVAGDPTSALDDDGAFDPAKAAALCAAVDSAGATIILTSN